MCLSLYTVKKGGNHMDYKRNYQSESTMEMPKIVSHQKVQCAACIYPFTGAMDVSMVTMACGATLAGIAM